MFLAIRELEQKPIRFQVTLPVGAIRFEPDFQQAAPLHASGEAHLSEALGEIRVQGKLSTPVALECDRCLEPFRHEVNEQFDLIYRPAQDDVQSGAEIAINASEANVGFFDGPGLELEEILKEQVILAVPMQRLCREDCQGICPECGNNRNQEPCGCGNARMDPRWSALRNLKSTLSSQ